jgi:hypothetical protein
MNPEERKAEYDELFSLMAEEFDFLATSGWTTITREDRERWQEFVRRINKLKDETMR